MRGHILSNQLEKVVKIEGLREEHEVSLALCCEFLSGREIGCHQHHGQCRATFAVETLKEFCPWHTLQM